MEEHVSVNFNAMKNTSNSIATIKVASCFNPRTKNPKAPFLKFNGECTEGGLEANNGEYGTQVTVWGNNKKLDPFEYFPDSVDTSDYEAVAAYLKGKTVSFEYYSQKENEYLNYFVSSPIEVGELFDEESSDDGTEEQTPTQYVDRQESISIGQTINLSFEAALRAHDKVSDEPIKGHALLTGMDYYRGFLKPYLNMLQKIDVEESTDTIRRILEEGAEKSGDSETKYPWDV